MSFKSFVLSLVLLLSASFSPAAETPYPTEDIPGRTIAEMTVRWVWYQMPSFIYACSKSEQCGLTAAERDIAAKISENKYYSTDTVVFASEKDQPGLFTSSKLEAHRIAVTGNSPADKIFLNSEKVEAQNTNLEFWAGLLAHEMSHHAGIPDDAQRTPDIFGAKIAKAFINNISALNAPEDSNGDISVLALTMPLPQTIGILKLFPQGFAPRFGIFDGRGVYNLSHFEDLLGRLGRECAKGSTRLTSHLSANRTIINPLAGNRFKNDMLFAGLAYCFDPVSKDTLANERTYILSFNSQLEKDGHYYFTKEYVDIDATNEIFNDPSGFPTPELLDLQVPTSVNAGETLVVTATMKSPIEKPITDCGFTLNVPGLGAQRGTFSMYNDDCKLKLVGDNTYQVQITRKIPPTTPAMKIELFAVCLSAGDVNKDGCYPVNPKKVTYIEIKNKAPSPAPEIKRITVKGAKNLGPEMPMKWIFPEGGTITLEVLISNAAGLDLFYFTGAVADQENNEGGLNGALELIPFIVQSHSYKQVGPDVLASFTIKFGDAMEGFHVKALVIDSLRIQTYDFKAVLKEFPNSEFAMGNPGFYQVRGN